MGSLVPPTMMKLSKVQRAIGLTLFLVILSACASEDTTVPTAASGQESSDIINQLETPTPSQTVTSSTAPQTATAKPTNSLVPTVTPTDTPTITPTPLPTATATPAVLSEIILKPVASGFVEPTYLAHAGDERLFVVEKAGRIQIVTGEGPGSTPFLDIVDRVGSNRSEQGLLSLAFHPNFDQNGRFYVNYTNLGGNTIVSSFLVSPDDPNRAQADSEQILLQVNQPFANHNGGQIKFGPDGYLYIGMGDGGSQGDPQNNGQDGRTLLGSLLRIDVDGGTPYEIPSNNPYDASSGQAEELWATGLRNPWRFSFDRQTGDLYLTDVGQNNWEEVNFQHANWTGGANYGWNILEGSHCYRTQSCIQEGLVLPVAEYSHDGGNCSITGGYVYRGEQYPLLRGNYFFADYCSGTFWSLLRHPDASWQQTVVLQSDLFVSSFGEDVNGELYALDIASGTIYQLTSP